MNFSDIEVSGPNPRCQCLRFSEKGAMVSAVFSLFLFGDDCFWQLRDEPLLLRAISDLCTPSRTWLFLSKHSVLILFDP